MASRRGKQRKGEKRRKSFENPNKEGEYWGNQCECGEPHKLPVKEVPRLLNGKQPCLVRPELWKKNRIHISCSLNGTWPWMSIGQRVSWKRNRITLLYFSASCFLWCCPLAKLYLRPTAMWLRWADTQAGFTKQGLEKNWRSVHKN